MINITEKELIIAFFQGGNAKDMHPDAMAVALEKIKEAANQSKVDGDGKRMATVVHPQTHPYR